LPIYIFDNFNSKKGIGFSDLSSFSSINAWANDKHPESQKNLFETWSMENIHSNKF